MNQISKEAAKQRIIKRLNLLDSPEEAEQAVKQLNNYMEAI
jgi:hypothetical protein